MEFIKIHPAGRFSGTVSVPGDKSISHRAAILGSLTCGTVHISGFLTSADCIATLNALVQLGVKIDGIGHTDVTVYGRGFGGFHQPEAPIDLGNSGTGLRLIAGLVSALPYEVTLTGDASLRSRPMKRITVPLTRMGASIEGEKCPLKIRGNRLRGIDYVSPVASAQVKSCILIAGLSADGKTSVTEPFKSRDHTERMLEYLGADITTDRLKVTVKGGKSLTSKDIDVPGDISSAVFILAFGILAKEGSVSVKGAGLNPTRTAVLDIFRRMGASLDISGPYITTRSSVLSGIDIAPEDVPGIIDELPLISVLAAFAHGRTTVRGAGELRVKETDRIRAVSVNLSRMGAYITEKEDGWVIEGRRKLNGAAVSSCGDHRIAMAMAVAGSFAEGETVIEDTGCINTSFPGFMDIVNSIRK